MNKALLQSIRSELTHAQRVVVASHLRPDGDAVGSLLGLGLALQHAGKQVQMVLADGVPLVFQNVPGVEQVVRKPKGEADLVIVVDCSDLERVGGVLAGLNSPDLNIDHHPTNLHFARINLVEPNAVSTTELLAELLEEIGLALTPAVAEALLLGLITDTLGFRTSNMTSKAMRTAAALMDMGPNLPALYYQALIERSYEALCYWGKGLSRVQREGRLIWTSLTLHDRAEVNYPGRDDADLVNILASVRDIDVALIFVEQRRDTVKISWRARPGFDTSKIALRFGGGGHTAASGAELEGALEDVQAEVLAATHLLLAGPLPETSPP